MPPRLQCLNAPLRVASMTPSSIAAFATTSRVPAPGDTRSPMRNSSELLAGLGSETTSRSNISSFSLPIRGRRTAPSAKSNPNEATSRILSHIKQSIDRNARQERQAGQFSLESQEQLDNNRLAANLSKQISRRWRAGDVYAPHDLSSTEMIKWKMRNRPEFDVFDVLALDPLMEYKNFSIMSEYMSPMGRIKSRKETGLRPVNQRKIAKAIRRSIGMGMMPSVHRHPELLQRTRMRVENNSAIRKGPV